MRDALLFIAFFLIGATLISFIFTHFWLIALFLTTPVVIALAVGLLGLVARVWSKD